MNSKGGCAVVGCTKPLYAKGLCMKHRERVRRGVPFEDLKPIRARIDNLARDSAGRKQCSGCRDWRSEECFTVSRSTRDLLNQRCRDCCAIQKMLSRYGLSWGSYEEMLLKQNGACAICMKAPNGIRLSVDHDHSCCPGDRSCGACVRGLLCGDCNRGIGLLGDTAASLRAAATYLEGF